MASRVIRVVMVTAVGAAAIGLAMRARAEDIPSKSSRAASSASHSASSRPAGGAVSLQALEAKLNEILEKQQQILARLDEVMAELQIVKVRATVR